MESPVFEEFEPAGDCDCPGCAHRRRVLPRSPAGRSPGHPAAHRTALVAAAVASARTPARQPGGPDVSAGEAGEAAGGSPQGPRAPLHGPGSWTAPVAAPVLAPAISRAGTIERARAWVARKIPYSVSSYWSDGYRQDCSGYVSMAWNLPGNEWTRSPGKYAGKSSRNEIQPGDMPLFHHASDSCRGSHVVLFDGWTDSARHVPYRCRGVTDGAAGAGAEAAAAVSSLLPPRTPFPGVAYFGPGAHNFHVTEFGRMLVRRGAGRFHGSPPGPRSTDEDRGATRAFQEAQGWRGAAAGGLPGPSTWELPVAGEGRDIPSGASASGVAGPWPAPSSHGVPGCPGRAPFRPGAENVHVTRLGRELVRKGFGRHCTSGPGPRRGEEDRRNVEAFQRAQGRRGGAADGCPDPETWRRLFS